MFWFKDFLFIFVPCILVIILSAWYSLSSIENQERRYQARKEHYMSMSVEDKKKYLIRFVEQCDKAFIRTTPDYIASDAARVREGIMKLKVEGVSL